MSSEDDSYSCETGDESFGYYSDDAAGCDSDSYEYFEEDEADDSNCVATRRQEQNYSILKEEDMQRLMEDDIARVSSVLSVSKVAAAILLHYYKWDVSEVHDAWFANEERVRLRVGLLESPIANLSITDELTCGICFESYEHDSIDMAGCGHPYCSLCWTGYITISIKDGPGCLLLKCPDPSCAAAVGQDMVKRHVCDKDMEKYSRYLLRSYIEGSSKNKWCPVPGCEYVIHFSAGSGGYDVSCLCSHTFCWNCNEDVHRPVDCTTARKWILKNSDESENVNWILTNSKPCPKCKRPIQKNQGCMHMVCRAPCNYEFCWLCLDNWSVHGQSTGGYYDCNRYNSDKRAGEYNEAERIRKRAEESLEKYTHYYERWTSNESSRERAQEDLQEMQDVHLKKLSKFLPEFQLKVVTDALLQVVECRRVLKWTYAYGYYIPEREHAKKNLFEYLQGEAESGLERLHHCAENELQPFLDADCDGPVQDFNDFSVKIDRLTRATRTYFDNLVGALENGLKDVSAAPLAAACSETTKIVATNNGEGRGKKGKKKKKGARSGESSRN